MPSINWRKGFFRLTLILSVFFGVFFGLIGWESGSLFTRFFWFVIPFSLVWGIYYLLLFIVKGFTDRS